jgi:peroxiredoxin
MLGGIGLLVFAGCKNAQERRAAWQKAQPQVVLQKDTDASTVSPSGDSLRGRQAPNFTLVDTAGHKVSLADFKGKPVVVNFWATWCAPCKLEMPWFEEFSHKYKDSGLVVLGLSQDDGATSTELTTAAKKIGVSYDILLPDDAAAKAYGGVDYLPETFYVNRSGTIVEETAGAPSKDEMEADIRKAIGNGA